VLDAIAAGKGPDKSLVALGYAGWEPGQLEAEMLSNTWLNVPASEDIIFDVPFEKRWSSAAESLGIDISRVSPHAGHA
jgi:putative transcriptional regulator